MKWAHRLEQALLRVLPIQWRARLLNESSESRAILRGIFWVAFFVLAAKFVAAGKEVVVAWRYGTSATLEGYLLLFNLASWPISLIHSVMGFVLVPWLVRLRQADVAVCAYRQQQVLAMVWGLAAILTVITACTLPLLLNHGALGLSLQGRHAAQGLLPWMAAIVGLGIVAAWHACQLMSVQKHANTFLEAMPALCLLLAVSLVKDADVASLLWATLGGFVLQFVLSAWVARAAGMPILPAWPRKMALSTARLSSAGWLLASQLVMSGAGVIDQLILAHLQQGSLAAYGYANRIIALALSLSALVFGRAMLPVFSAADKAESYRLAGSWAWRAFWVGVAGAVVIIVMAHPAVALLYQRGAFGANDTDAVAHLLVPLAFQIPFYLAVIVWVNWAAGRSELARPMWWAATIGCASKFIFAFVLISIYEQGAAAVSLAQTVWLLVYLLVLNKFVKKLKNRQFSEKRERW